MAYDRYPAVDEDFLFPPEVREANALAPEFRNQVVPMTQTQRNNLTGDELWNGRLVLNTTTNRIDRYDLSSTDWITMTTEPAGIIKVDAGATVPDFHLVCDGSVVDRTGIYAALFARIGTQYNTGGESGAQFRLPNLKGKVVVGVNAAESEFNDLGETGGEKSLVLTEAEMPSHEHSGNTGDDTPDHGHGTDVTSTDGIHAHAMHLVDDPMASGGLTTKSYTAAAGDMTDAAGAHNHSVTVGAADSRHHHPISTAGSDAAHNNLQPYIALNYIITL
jgi:microcystin-dependent protein